MFQSFRAVFTTQDLVEMIKETYDLPDTIEGETISAGLWRDEANEVLFLVEIPMHRHATHTMIELNRNKSKRGKKQMPEPIPLSSLEMVKAPVSVMESKPDAEPATNTSSAKAAQKKAMIARNKARAELEQDQE